MGITRKKIRDDKKRIYAFAETAGRMAKFDDRNSKRNVWHKMFFDKGRGLYTSEVTHALTN
jgi:hypothetical protein